MSETVLNFVLFWGYLSALLGIISLWLIFSESKIKGVFSLVPIYNYVKLLRIAKLPGWLWLTVFLPPAALVVAPAVSIAIGKQLGKLYAVGAFLFCTLTVFVAFFTSGAIAAGISNYYEPVEIEQGYYRNER